MAAGAVLAASGLLGTYLAAIRPQPTYASPNSGGSSQAFRSLLTPSARPAGCPVAPAGWDDTYVSTEPELRTAVTTADESTFICVTESLALTGGQLDVDDTTLTITGRDDSEVTIDLAGNKRFIDANLGGAGDDTLTIRNLTIENGDAGFFRGGAIYVKGNGALLVESSRFVENDARYAEGGAIFSYVPLEINDSAFIGSYSGDAGGAIHADSSLTVRNSEFSENHSDNGSGAIHAQYTLFVSDSYFKGNVAYAGFGGAIFVDDTATLSKSVFVSNYTEYNGGAVSVDRAIVSVEDCRFVGNDAGEDGAALYIRGRTGGASKISASSFISNGDDIAPTNGGGVFKYKGDLVISNSLFWGNEATNGGAIGLKNYAYDDTITYTTIVYNEAVTDGGGVFVGGPDPRVNIHNSILFGNRSGASDSDVVGNGADVTLRNSTFTAATSLSGVTVDATSVTGDPLLPQPGNNGGPVIGSDDSATFLPTTIPGIGSPAIGRADSSLLPAVTVDQIGAARTSRTAGAMNASPNPTPPPPTPTFLPSAPLSVTGQPGNASATVTWTAPSSAGSFPITDYQAIVAPGGQTCLVQAPATSCTITGLSNGTEYTAIVRALNGAGWGASSDPSEPFTPVGPVEKSIMITGTRAQIDGRSGVRALGETIGLVGATVQARVHLSGEVDYYDGSRRTVAQDGSFTWQRFTNKKVYVYFRTLDGEVRSNRIVIALN